MPKKLDRELTELKERIIAMGDTANEMLETAMRALAQRDPELVSRLDELEEQMDRYQVENDDAVVRLMAMYGPVAVDLRFVMMVARINTELERIGDQSVNMCENIQLLLSDPGERNHDLPRMADIAGRMVKEALQAFKEGSIPKAREVIKTDGEVDALHDQVFRDLLTSESGGGEHLARSVALILTARSLERIADHATNVAEEVIYMVKGEDVRHPEAMQGEDEE